MLVLFGSTSIASGAQGQYEVTWRVPFDQKAQAEFTTWPSLFPGGKAFTGVLPVCSQGIVEDCLKSVEYKNPSGDWLLGKFVSYFPIEQDFVTQPGKVLYPNVGNALPVNPVTPSKMPPLARSSVWQFPSITHSLGNDFLVAFWIFGNGDDATGPEPGPNIRASVQPMRAYSERATPEKIAELSRYAGLADEPNEQTICYYQGEDVTKYCIERGEFTQLAPIRMTLQLKIFSKLFWSVGGWLTTRVSDPQIKVQDDPLGTRVVQLTGTPVTLASGQTTMPATVENYILGRKILNYAYKQAWPNSNSPEFDLADTSCFNPLPQNYVQECSAYKFRSIAGSYPSAAKESFFLWQELSKLAPIVPINKNVAWSFSTSGSTIDPYTIACLRVNQIKDGATDSPNGYIASNATIIDPNPASWDADNQSLNFSIASIVNQTSNDGDTQFYELNIKEALGKCLWKVDLSQAQVQIQIFNTGTEQLQRVETTSLFKQGDYLKFKVSGINVSSSVIRVKLLGAPITTGETVTDAPEVASAPKIKKIQTKTILCVKGRVSKKVVGTKPTCPRGYTLNIKRK